MRELDEASLADGNRPRSEGKSLRAEAMASRAEDLIPVVQKSYDLCAGLYTHVNRFPRAQRGLLGRVILEDALQMLVSLTVANRRVDKAETLREASGRLDALRITLRLGKRLGFVSNGGYEDLSKGADEIGRMLGGWLKHETRREDGEATRAQPPPQAREPRASVRQRVLLWPRLIMRRGERTASAKYRACSRYAARTRVFRWLRASNRAPDRGSSPPSRPGRAPHLAASSRRSRKVYSS